MLLLLIFCEVQISYSVPVLMLRFILTVTSWWVIFIATIVVGVAVAIKFRRLRGAAIILTYYSIMSLRYERL